MKTTITRGLLTALAFMLVAGCSGMTKFERAATCVAAGATIGGAAGGMNEGRDAVKGAIGGALAGALICAMIDNDDDNDGVNNMSDKCPGTPAYAAVDEKGCAKDSDEDGVADYRDQCPGTPKGTVVDSHGCPKDKPVVNTVKDDDVDGVVNADDLCPGTPRGTKVDDKGCPRVQKIVMQGVNFEFDSATLTGQAESVLLDQVRVLEENPAQAISVTGHTDSYGPDGYNKDLSLDRARAVRDFLEKSGVDESIVTVSGAGELEPVADNSTLTGRSQNRRVELQIIRE